MSLQVWLPLNGNLNNQGLSNVTVTNSGATVDNNGKIGKCYSFSSSKRITVSQPTNLSTTQASLACWVYLSSWGSSYDSLINLSTGTSWTDTRLALVRNNQQNRIGFCVSNGSNYNMVTMSNDFPLNVWTHLIGVFDGSIIKIYVNGVLNNSATTTFNTLVYSSSVLNIGSWSNAFNYPINGKMNDVRIYNHALSAKEVKEISKGLVLHYKLDNNGCGNPNLLKGNFSCTSNKTTYTSNGNLEFTLSASELLSHKGENLILSMDMYSVGVSTSSVTTYQKDRFGVHGYIKYTLEGGTSTVAYPLILFSLGQNGRKSVSWQIPSNIVSIENNLSFSIQTNPNSGFAKPSDTNNETWYIKNIKLEFGSKATQWCPNSADTLYSQLGLNNNIEYDCSGYGNNGTKNGTISYSVNSPRYSVNYKFNNSYITSLSNNNIVSILNSNTHTISCWINTSELTTSNQAYFVCRTPSGSSAECQVFLAIKEGAITHSYYSDDWSIPYSLKTNTWYHIVFVSNNKQTICYINGNQIASTTKGSLNISNNAIPTFGADSDRSSRFNGGMSDARIYATALSADDIKELYQTSASIDNNGNLYAYSLVEE